MMRGRPQEDKDLKEKGYRVSSFSLQCLWPKVKPGEHTNTW